MYEEWFVIKRAGYDGAHTVYHSYICEWLIIVLPVVMGTGLFRPEKSQEGPRMGRDRTGQDQETLKVLWSCGPGTKEFQKSWDFFLRSRDSPAPFLDRNFANKVQN